MESSSCSSTVDDMVLEGFEGPGMAWKGVRFAACWLTYSAKSLSACGGGQSRCKGARARSGRITLSPFRRSEGVGF